MLISDLSCFRLAALAAALVFASAAARADELAEAGALLRAGEHHQAMDRVNKVLADKPRDPQARFLKGLIYTEQGNTRAAVEMFRKLTEDYPELPEPYNNLAVIYASQGEYDKARAALEKSIRTHPSYATAYENLGDVYAKLASQAYDKALKLDSTNAGAQNKLALVRELVGSSPREAAPAKISIAAQKPAHGKPAAAQDAARPAQAAAAPATGGAKPAPQKVAPAPKPAPQETADHEAVIAAVKAWAEAWSRQDADAYLAFYAKDFRTPQGEPRAAWEKTRRERLQAPKNITISVTEPRVSQREGARASVTFRQEYKSDRLSSRSTKTLLMVKSDGGRWLIQQEQVAN